LKVHVLLYSQVAGTYVAQLSINALVFNQPMSDSLMKAAICPYVLVWW